MRNKVLSFNSIFATPNSYNENLRSKQEVILRFGQFQLNNFKQIINSIKEIR